MKLAAFPIVALLLASSSIYAAPICQSDTDPDGDGWGWENNASCQMPSGGNNNSNNNTDLTVSTLLGQCITELAQAQANTGSASSGGDANCVDTAPVGDGWGWNGVTSCRVTADNSQAQQCTTTTNGSNNGSQGGQYGTGFTDYTNQHPTCEEANDRLLRLVTENMHESEVLRLVGKPRNVETSYSNRIRWSYYSRSNGFYAPIVYFDRDTRRVTSFSVDSTNCN